VTVRAWLAEAAARLAAAGVSTPAGDAEWMLAHTLRVARSHVALELDRGLTPEEADRLAALLDRRARREPLAYVLGEWGFRRLTLKTDARALVPRPETETVVERCLALLAGRERPRVLDIGTGSGAIALAVADEHPGAEVTAVDVSEEALALARENAERTGIAVTFRNAGQEAAAEGWDLVVSNPPYVSEAELATVQPEVREWEPRVAVVGEGHHEAIARAARTDLLVFEVGERQAADVAALLREVGYGGIRITRDLGGRERVVEGRRP
jgi:release factor glutamine methyltransferase